MSFPKPFHRNWRAMKPAPNSGYSGWAYIHDRDYAKNAEHYVRALVLIQNDLQSIFEYLEPSDESRTAYSYRIHALLMRTCVEVEANFKESWSRKSEQGDKWSFCLTAGTLCPANQERP